MSQYEKKCECRQYDDADDHRSALIKMQLPEYEDSQYGGTSFIIYRAIRMTAYVVVLVLLGYSLWRIQVIESTLVASDRFTNITRLLALENSHYRIVRSIKTNNQIELNSFGLDNKDLPRGSMLTSKNEKPSLPKKKVVSQNDFDHMVKLLFDKIHVMHNDTDRSHFDNNMKAVFQAWFPVFDELLHLDMMENEGIRKVKSADKSSESSSEEHKNVMNNTGEKELSKKHRKKGNVKSSEEKKTRKTRSIEDNSNDSSDSSEGMEPKTKLEYPKRIRSGLMDKTKKYLPNKYKLEKESSDSSESSGSSEKMSDKINVDMIYEMVTQSQNAVQNEIYAKGY